MGAAPLLCYDGRMVMSAGHRFTHSPWHRSAQRQGVTGSWFPRHVVSGGHRFTVMLRAGGHPGS